MASAGNIDELPAGFPFGNYAIRELIGRGGMARVYRAEHLALNKLVALKVMDGSLQDKSAGHRRFLREGQAAAAVKHPHVVDITDVGIWEGLPYLVMELLQGQDLASHLRERGPLHDAELAHLALPIIAGLAVLHDAGVEHRDLKPSNIFLARGADGDVVPKVLDFGISKVVRKTPAPELLATPFGEVMGTPLYMPPEALDGTRDLTPLSDQYSLGVVLYECIAGRPPFRADSLVSLLNLIAAGQFEPPSKLRPDISASVERAILRAMSFHPADRFSHVRDFGRALWEIASPRTQLLWARSFDVRIEALPRGSRLALGRSVESATLQSNVPSPTRNHPYQVTRRIPSSRQRRRKQLALVSVSSAALTLVLGLAIAHSRRQAPTPAPPIVLAPPQPGLASEPSAPVSTTQAALRPEAVAAPAQPRPPSGEAESGRSPEKAPTARRREPRSRAPGNARSSAARSLERATDEAPIVSSPAPGATPARRADEAASEEEFPGIFRAEPGSADARPAPPRAPEGANESPILD